MYDEVLSRGSNLSPSRRWVPLSRVIGIHYSEVLYKHKPSNCLFCSLLKVIFIFYTHTHTYTHIQLHLHTHTHTHTHTYIQHDFNLLLYVMFLLRIKTTLQSSIFPFVCLSYFCQYCNFRLVCQYANLFLINIFFISS